VVKISHHLSFPKNVIPAPPRHSCASRNPVPSPFCHSRFSSSFLRKQESRNILIKFIKIFLGSRLRGNDKKKRKLGGGVERDIIQISLDSCLRRNDVRSLDSCFRRNDERAWIPVTCLRRHRFHGNDIGKRLDPCLRRDDEVGGRNDGRGAGMTGGEQGWQWEIIITERNGKKRIATITKNNSQSPA